MLTFPKAGPCALTLVLTVMSSNTGYSFISRIFFQELLRETQQEVVAKVMYQTEDWQKYTPSIISFGFFWLYRKVGAKRK